MLLCLVLFYSFELAAECFYFGIEIGWNFKVGPVDSFQIVMAFFLPEELTEVEGALDYLRDLLIVKPLDAFSLFPESTFDGRLRYCISS